MALRRVNERLSALGNVVVCNDHVAIVHPDVSKELEDALREVCKVEVFRYVLFACFSSTNACLQIISWQLCTYWLVRYDHVQRRHGRGKNAA